MSQEYDRIFKENIEEIILPLAQKVLGLPDPERLIEVPDDIQRTVERRPDFLKIVATTAGQNQYVLQLEFQTADEPDMVYRMLEYSALLLRKYKIPVRQFVFYIGSKPARMVDRLEQEDLTFRFYVRNVVETPYTEFLATTKPEEALLAILADLGNDAPETVVNRILFTLRSLVPGVLDLEKFLRQLEMLAKLRDLQDLTIKQIEKMPLTYDLETDIRFLQGKEKGKLEGQEAGRYEARREDIRALLKANMGTPEQIALVLNVPLSFVFDIQADITRNDS